MQSDTIQGTQEFVPRSLKEVGVYEVEVVKATNETLGDLGFLVDDFDVAEVQIVQWPQQGHRPVLPGTGLGGGVTEGDFEMVWNGVMLQTHNHAVGGHYITGWSCDPSEATQNKPVSNFANFKTSPSSSIKVGQKVEHARFGKGKVLSIEGTSGNEKATIEFNDFGQKLILMKFAKLRIIE